MARGAPSRPYGGPYALSITLDGEEKILEDVWLGDVYLLGGQSNMQMKLNETNFSPEQYAGNEHIRAFSPTDACAADGWVVLTRENAGELSTIGYHVAQSLAREDRKIGLLACNRGASVIQSWLSPSLVKDPRFQVENKSGAHVKYPHNAESFLYETVVSRLMPYSMAAALWYQGEANASEGEAPIYLFWMLETLISSWRREFLDETLPFIVVQLADFVERDTPWWRMIQSEQLRAAEVIPYVKSVVCRDICEDDCIHPPTKHLLTARIAALLEES